VTKTTIAFPTTWQTELAAALRFLELANSPAAMLFPLAAFPPGGSDVERIRAARAILTRLGAWPFRGHPAGMVQSWAQTHLRKTPDCTEPLVQLAAAAAQVLTEEFDRGGQGINAPLVRAADFGDGLAEYVETDPRAAWGTVAPPTPFLVGLVGSLIAGHPFRSIKPTLAHARGPALVLEKKNPDAVQAFFELAEVAKLTADLEGRRVAAAELAVRVEKDRRRQEAEELRAEKAKAEAAIAAAGRKLAELEAMPAP
jgi:hypothetical protein